jgi:hypothetical protein
MKQLIFLVILGEFILGCREVKNNQNNVNEKTMETTSEEGYYFQMDTVKQKEFLKKISLLSIGDTLSNVLNILGKPDYDQIGMRKERDEFICRTLTFYVAKSVEFVLDKENRIIKIESNIEGHEFTKSINDPH